MGGHGPCAESAAWARLSSPLGSKMAAQLNMYVVFIYLYVHETNIKNGQRMSKPRDQITTRGDVPLALGLNNEHVTSVHISIA